MSDNRLCGKNLVQLLYPMPLYVISNIFMIMFSADIMKSHGANTIIAVDVGSEYPAELTNYGDHLSGWWLLWKKWNPFSETVYVSIVLWSLYFPNRWLLSVLRVSLLSGFESSFTIKVSLS